MTFLPGPKLCPLLITCLAISSLLILRYFEVCLRCPPVESKKQKILICFDQLKLKLRNTMYWSYNNGAAILFFYYTNPRNQTEAGRKIGWTHLYVQWISATISTIKGMYWVEMQDLTSQYVPHTLRSGYDPWKVYGSTMYISLRVVNEHD